MASPRRLSSALRVVAVALAVIVLTHAALQAFGSLEFWAPCFALGHNSNECEYLQYSAPGPWWLTLLAAWPVEVAGAVAVLVLAIAARAHTALASAGLLCVLLSNTVTDYVLTPLFNGGYVSADNPPGYGMVGAVLLGAAGVLFALVAALPVRRSITAARPEVAAV